MTEVVVAVILAMQGIGVALIANRGRQHAKAAREQVQNSHTVNLRDDLDDRFSKLNERLDRTDRRIGRLEGYHVRDAQRATLRRLIRHYFAR